MLRQASPIHRSLPGVAAVLLAACTPPLAPVTVQSGKTAVASYYASLSRPVKTHSDVAVNDPTLQLKITNLNVGKVMGGAKLSTKNAGSPEAGELDFELTDDLQIGNRPPHAMAAVEEIYDPADGHEDSLTVTDKTAGVQRRFDVSHDMTMLTISEGPDKPKGLAPYSIKFQPDGSFLVSDGKLATLMTKLFHVAGPSSLAHFQAVQGIEVAQVAENFASSPVGQDTPAETVGEAYEGGEGNLMQPESTDFATTAASDAHGPGSGSACDAFLRQVYLARRDAK